MRAAVISVVVVFVTAFLFAACGGDDLRGNITIVIDPGQPQWRTALEELVTLTPARGLRVADEADDGYRIEVVDVASIPLEGYRLSVDGDRLRVEAHDVLGAQYGVSAALEALGFRFRHPFEAYVPTVPELAPIDDAVQQPAIRVRGFQFHTLHPIEAYFAFWEPSPGSLNDARRIIDWTIKNRGNYVQWVPVDNIMDPAQHEPWKAYTQEVLAYAHARGVRVGLNIQLFGQSNLQQAFDLSDDDTGMVPIADEVAARLPLITTDLPFDVYHLSFGEFFNAEPQRFIDAINEVRNQFRVFAPQAEIHGFVHVGEEQRLDFMGENLIFYFLVKYADASIVPDIHTVMFYNLFETAGGAYQHENFNEHLAYLRERMCAGKPVAYVPETAYWIAFDNSVPQYYPLYVHNRWLDLHEIRKQPGACGTLDQHILFTTGWEWGYWLHDVTALRASYTLPASPAELIAEQYAPDLGPPVAALITRLVNAQREWLHLGHLVAYISARDGVIDLGDSIDIRSQPDRVQFSELRTVEETAAFRADVWTPLSAYARRVTQLRTELEAYTLPESRWARELRDGFHIDEVRARYIVALYAATMAHVEGDAEEAHLQYERAEALFAEAKGVVASRHGDLHDTHGRRLTDRVSTKTTFQYGYLFMADTLCFWERELVQVGNLVGETMLVPQGCFF